MRLVDADALIAWTDNYYDSEKFTIAHFVNMIKDMPTIEPERKTGKWVLVTDGNGQHFICDHCGEWRYHQNQKFCGECGAKIEEPEDIPMEYFESGGR